MRVALGVLRLLVLVTLGVVWFFEKSIDHLIATFWSWLRIQAWYRVSYFETVHVPVYGFILTYIFYHMYKWSSLNRFRIDPASRMTKPSKAQMAAIIVTYMLPLLALDLVTVKRYHGAFVAPEDLEAWPVLERKLPHDSPGIRRIVFDLAGSLFIYDIIFALQHYALHRSAYLYKILHCTHHEHAAIDVSITTKMEVIERVMIVLSANESLKLFKAHPLTRSLFVFVFVFLFIENHSGFDFPLNYDKVVPFNIMGGARRHAYHHKHGTRYFQPYFTWIDDYIFFAKALPQQSHK